MRLLPVLLFVLGLAGMAVAVGPAQAQGLPALHDVTGVGAGDALNVRSGPGVNNGVVGTLAHDARGIEVIRTEGSWAMINYAEGTGWTSLRFLARRDDGDLANTQRVVCSGTEPFWSLDIRQGQTSELRRPDTALVEVFNVGLFQKAPAALPKSVLRGVGGARELAVIVTLAQCSDGMSDREYGLDATVIVTGAQGPTYSGCCSLTDF